MWVLELSTIPPHQTQSNSGVSNPGATADRHEQHKDKNTHKLRNKDYGSKNKSLRSPIKADSSTPQDSSKNHSQTRKNLLAKVKCVYSIFSSWIKKCKYQIETTIMDVNQNCWSLVTAGQRTKINSSTDTTMSSNFPTSTTFSNKAQVHIVLPPHKRNFWLPIVKASWNKYTRSMSTPSKNCRQSPNTYINSRRYSSGP